MDAAEVIHELINELDHSNLRQVAMSLIANKPHSEDIR
jgi:hypothetical protein